MKTSLYWEEVPLNGDIIPLASNAKLKQNKLFSRFSEDFFCEMPKKFLKSHAKGTEMTFIAAEK